ncbi:MAG TPA: LysM peptidoglycan-binding domain-containing protein, partial [Tissierellia bacterium]|nr:LysM peptidoglycan-binding domain-containing protein [Tissierellia bacterium]
MYDSVEGKKTCPMGSFPYTIRSGDTLYKLAKTYNTTVEAIMAINPGIDPYNLQIGQVICIPRAMPPGPPPCPNGFYYTIRSGDTLYNIGQRYNVSVEALMRANPGIDPYNLQIGQVICIPKAMPPVPPPCPNGFYYTIRSGDTLYNIGQRYNVSVEA